MEGADRKTKMGSSADGSEECKRPRNESSVDLKAEAEPDVSKLKDNLSGVTFEIVTNNGDDDACTRLVDLKNIFSRQLPKMPKEYIVRLVFDHRHISVAMVRHGRTIGGICYRPYPDQRFGEIAFCAISGNEQLKGYGSILMNQLKRHVQKDKIEYFLTYADNYAIGYFQRQGFSKSISMPKERWMGYIKDYDGGTLMECYVHPGVDYLNIKGIVAKQRAFIMQRIKERSEAETVHDGLELFQSGRRLQSLMEVPGVAEAGWTPFHLYKGSTERDRNLNQTRQNAVLKGLLDKVRNSIHATYFRMPAAYASTSTSIAGGNRGAASSSSGGSGNSVSQASEPEQLQAQARAQLDPIDLTVITARLRLNDYYRSHAMMREDLLRMICNAKALHAPDSEVAVSADELQKLVAELFSGDSNGGGSSGGGGTGGGAGAGGSSSAAATS